MVLPLLAAGGILPCFLPGLFACFCFLFAFFCYCFFVVCGLWFVALVSCNSHISTVIFVIHINVSSYMYRMTLKGMTLGFSKRPYLQQSIYIVTQGDLLKLKHFDTDTDTF